MKMVSRIFLFGSLALILLTACTGQDASTTATVVGTGAPGDQTATPFPPQTDTASTATTATPAFAGTVGVDLTATIPTATDIEGATATGAAQAPGTGDRS